MKKEIKALLREEGLTGEQVGQRLIQDMVRLYREAQGEKPEEPQLTERDKQQLVSVLADPMDILVYSQYKAAQRYLLQVNNLFLLAFYQVEISFLRLYSAISRMEDNEELLDALHSLPRWMTREEYEAACRAEDEKVRAQFFTSATCVQYMCLALARSAALIPGDWVERAREAEALGPREAPAFFVFLRDNMGELWEAVVTALARVPGFSARQPQREVAMGDCMAAGLDFYSGMTGTVGYRVAPNGYAQLLDGTQAPDLLRYDELGFDAMIKRLGEGLSATYLEFLSACRQGLAVETALRLVGERIGVARVDVFIPPSQLEARFHHLVSMLDDLANWALTTVLDEHDVREMLRELFPPVRWSDLAPAADRVTAAREALAADLGIVERPQTLHELLLRAPGEGERRDA